MSADSVPPAPSRPTLQGAAPASAASAPFAAAGGASAASLSVLASINASSVVVPRRTGGVWALGGAALTLAGAAAWWFVGQPAGGQAEPDWRASSGSKTPSETLPAAGASAAITGTPAPVASQVAAASAPAPASAPVAATARIENSTAAELAAAAALAVPRAAAASAPVERVRAAASTRPDKSIRAANAAARKPKVAVAKAKPRTPPPTRTAKAALPPQPDAGSAISPAAFGPKRDTDVDLLEAMVAHDNRAPRGAGVSAKPAAARPSLTQQIARCNEPGVSDPLACVAAVCAGRVGDEGRCAGVARVP